MLVDLGVQHQPPIGQRPQRPLRGRGGRGGRAWTQRRDRADKGHLAGDADEALTQQLRRIHQQGLECDHRLGPGLDGGIAGDLEVADHLDGTIARLGLSLRVASQHAACGGLGIDSVGLAVPAPELAVDPANLDHAQAHGSQCPGKTSAEGSGTLDTHGMHGTMTGCPVCELPVALGSYRKGCGGKPRAQPSPLTATAT